MSSPSLSSINPWLALSASIVLGAVAQVALKHGANKRSAHVSVWQVMRSPWVLLWAGSFIAATVLWIAALGRLDISYAYPLLGFGYVLVTAMAAVLLKEKISAMHWVAVLLITAGAAFVAESV